MLRRFLDWESSTLASTLVVVPMATEKRPTVLVVDSVQRQVRAFRPMLEAAGFRVTRSSARQALSNPLPDLILAAVELSGSEGFCALPQAEVQSSDAAHSRDFGFRLLCHAGGGHHGD